MTILPSYREEYLIQGGIKDLSRNIIGNTSRRKYVLPCFSALGNRQRSHVFYAKSNSSHIKINDSDIIDLTRYRYVRRTDFRKVNHGWNYILNDPLDVLMIIVLHYGLFSCENKKCKSCVNQNVLFASNSMGIQNNQDMKYMIIDETPRDELIENFGRIELPENINYANYKKFKGHFYARRVNGPEMDIVFC